MAVQENVNSLSSSFALVDLKSHENYLVNDNNPETLLDEDYDNNDNFSACHFHEDLTSDVDSNDQLHEKSPLLHQFTSISTKSYCVELLKLLRNANVCKSHSNRFITLIQSILPIPNNFPSTFKHILSLLNIEDLFIKRSVCLVCKTDLHFNGKKCSRCRTMDKKLKADIYDIDLENVLSKLLKRLSCDIEKYKEKIKNNIDDYETKDIPFCLLYRNLLQKYHLENIISILLHVDGISLTRSTRLKMWLFCGSFVELPPSLRCRRYNMLLLSIWVGYTEPEPKIWLKTIILKINYLKTQGKYFASY